MEPVASTVAQLLQLLFSLLHFNTFSSVFTALTWRRLTTRRSLNGSRLHLFPSCFAVTISINLIFSIIVSRKPNKYYNNNNNLFGFLLNSCLLLVLYLDFSFFLIYAFFYFILASCSFLLFASFVTLIAGYFLLSHLASCSLLPPCIASCFTFLHYCFLLLISWLSS